MPVNAIPICYVGSGLGAAPRARLGPGRETHWNKSDRRVQMIPEAQALNLLRDNPEDFRRCVKVADGHGGLSADALMALAKSGAVHVETYTPKGEGDPVAVLVLDDVTAAGLAAAASKPPESSKPPKKSAPEKEK